tara:strand:- start:9840 stop:10691 length:852 start_codon:yes stop_codon:yes gene_type:complete
MLMLEKTNKHPRDKLLFFDVKRHAYRTTTCPYLKSVTSIIAKQFAKFEADKVISKMMESVKWNPSNKYYGKTPTQIKKQWNDNGKLSRDAGNLVHEQIEIYLNAESDEIELELADDTFCRFQEWDESRGWTPYRTEWRIFDEESKIAGTVDAVFINENGQYVIVDWKRCGNIDMTNRFEKSTNPSLDHLPNCKLVKYSLQLNLYKYILEKNYGISIAAMYIVNIHPSQTSFEELEALYLSKEILTILHPNKEIVPSAQDKPLSNVLDALKNKGIKISGTLYIQ